MNLVEIKYENILAVDNSEAQFGCSSNSPMTLQSLTKKYSDVFEGTGLLQGKYKLDLDPSVTPVVHPPRKVPVAMREQLRNELQRLVDLNIIAPVTEPTP